MKKFLNYTQDWVDYFFEHIWLHVAVIFMLVISTIQCIMLPTFENISDKVVLCVWVLNWYFVFIQWRKSQKRAEMWQIHASKLMDVILNNKRPNS